MEFTTPRQLRTNSQPVWHGAAFIVEALVLLAFVVAAIALFMQMFGRSHDTGAVNGQLSQAVVLASDSAEHFAADPTAVAATQAQDGLLVTCNVTPETTEAGTLYHADIAVTDQAGNEVYQVSTARYVSEVA